MGVQQKMIHESAWKEINDIEENNLFVVGVNCNTEENEEITPAMKIDNENELRQVNKLNNYKKNRDQEKISQELEKLRKVCEGNDNVMPSLIDALKSGATVGEVNGVMREVFGTWVSPSGV